MNTGFCTKHGVVDDLGNGNCPYCFNHLLNEDAVKLLDGSKEKNQCKQCPWVIGDTQDRDCGYPDCCA